MYINELLFQRDNLHHAYFIEGEKEAIVGELENFLKKAFDIVRTRHPDVHYAEHQSFGIGEARLLQEMQSMKPIAGDRKIFIIILQSITNEAQNSLLKVFEEPTPGTHFFIISSFRQTLLPTLQSRMVMISHSSIKNISFEDEVKEFIKETPKNRLSYVSKMIEEKDKASAEEFLKTLVSKIHKNKLKENGATIKEILSLSKYLKDRSSSLKLILERVALLDL